LEEFTKKRLYPFSRFYLRNIAEAFGRYWKNHFSTIGIIGMNDALLNLIDTDITKPEGIDFALQVMDFMRDRLSDYQEVTGDIFNLEATPAEGASFRLAQLDRENYPEIRFYNLSENRSGKLPYYTNSTQLPVGFTDDIFAALKYQDELQSKYTGGTVLHCFLGERMPSSEATWNMVKAIAENFRLPYYTLTPTFSICEDHGYLQGEHANCPQCGESCEVWSRPVGYLRPVDQWNVGKQEEFKDRRTYDRQLIQSKPVVLDLNREADGHSAATEERQERTVAL
jgi:ribonucleoside-triphosphate reductase